MCALRRAPRGTSTSAAPALRSSTGSSPDITGGVSARIEDTDRDRSTDEAIDQILAAMTWLGLDWDQEGPEADGAYRGYSRQTSRFEIYRAHAERLPGRGPRVPVLLHAGGARRAARSGPGPGETFRYDGRCRDLPLRPGVPAALRLRIPDSGTTVVPDLVHGDVTFDRATLDDWILVRSDGTPTYNFCVVVDDVTMKITHVIRGNDHLSNTPKQILCYEALGYPLPVFAHIPMILDRPEAPLEAPRRDVRPGVPRRGIPARGDGQLLRAASAGPTATRRSSRKEELVRAASTSARSAPRPPSSTGPSSSG